MLNQTWTRKNRGITRIFVGFGNIERLPKNRSRRTVCGQNTGKNAREVRREARPRGELGVGEIEPETNRS